MEDPERLLHSDAHLFSMPTQLAAVRAFISSHETLNPPSPGQWSNLRSHEFPSDFCPLLDSLTKDTLPVESRGRRQIIAVLLDWLATWDAECWPEDNGMNIPSFQCSYSQIARAGCVTHANVCAF